MEPISLGLVLRRARERWGYSLKEVMDRSQVLAQRWNSPGYYISHSWLDRVERDKGALSGTKLLVLAAIYGLTVEDMLAACAKAGQSQPSLDEAPNKTLLLSGGHHDSAARQWLPDSLVTEPPPDATTLIPTPEGALPAQYRRGIIGRRDRTLEPMIPPGSLVLVDTSRCTIPARKRPQSEFERPIYFFVTRNEYLSGFCELDREAEWLTLVPHALSPEPNRRFRFRKEIEVIGTVAGVFSRRMLT